VIVVVFESEHLSLRLLDILFLDQKNVSMLNAGRHFDALSFRIRSDAKLQTAEGEYPMTDGSLCYVPAHLDYRRTASYDKMIVVHFHTSEYVGRTIERFTPTDVARMEALFFDIWTCFCEKKAGWVYRATALLYEIFAVCFEECSKGKVQTSKIAPSMKYLLSHYTDPNLSIAELAKKSFISEVYFRKLFKAEYGISPRAYLIDLRIRHAISLMATGYYSLQEVAALSGYSDYQYFSTEFRRRKGVSPSAYRYNYG
jgi:AraC-like DNA-binding protein